MAALDHANTMLLFASVLVVAGILSSLIATRFGAPMLAIFLGIGMLAGEDGLGGFHFADYALAYLIGSLALAVILFDGGLATRFSRLKRNFGPALALATAGVFITAIVTGACAYVLLGLKPLEGFLVGAIVASTDAAAVFFLLRTGGLQLKSHVGATLEIESGINDPFAVFLTVTTVGLIAAGETAPGWSTLFSLIHETLIGVAIGVGSGFALTWLLNRITLPTGLHPLLVVAAAVLIYAVTAEAGGSGLLAAYLAGLVVGNRPVRAFASIASLNEAMTWLAQIVMFLVLGLLVTPHTLFEYALPAAAIAMVLMFVARPLSVWLCLALFRFDWREKLFVSWVGLRGAVSIFLSAIPILTGLPHGELYFNVAFFVVLISLLLQGWTIKPAARKLKQALPRQTARVTRVELDLPGQLEMEMVGYPVLAHSPVLELARLPSWARPVLIIRHDEIVEPAKAGALRPGDYAYLLAAPARVHHLDRLFAAHGEHGPLHLAGEFLINGNAPIDELDRLYGLGASDAEKKQTVAGLFSQRFDETPEMDDSLMLGRAELIVRAVEGDTVIQAGLELPNDESDPLAGAVECAVAGWRRPFGFLQRKSGG